MKNAIYTWGNQREPGAPGKEYWGAREWRRYEARQAKRAQKRQQREDAEETAAVAEVRGCLWEVLKFVLAFALLVAGLRGNRVATLLLAGYAVYTCWKRNPQS